MGNGEERLLLIDTCGESSGVAVSAGEQVLASEDLLRGSASAEILQAVHRLLIQLGWQIESLDAIGVVSGPGSFTGIRAGLATAKGLCESLSLPLAAVSRLEVLAEAAGLHAGWAALDAGRGELYLREVASGREWLSPIEDLRLWLRGDRDPRRAFLPAEVEQSRRNGWPGEVVAVEPEAAGTEPDLAAPEFRVALAEHGVLERLGAGSATILRPLRVSDALPSALRRLRAGGSDVALAEANYVREERDIYRMPAAQPKPAESVR